MRWLLTVRSSADLVKLAGEIESRGGQQDEQIDPVPLGDSEFVLQVTGSRDMAEELKQVADVVDVYPDSDLTLY